MAAKDLILMGLGPSYKTYLITLGLGSLAAPGSPAAPGSSAGYRPRMDSMESTYRTSPITQDAYLKAVGDESSYRKSNDE